MHSGPCGFRRDVEQEFVPIRRRVIEQFVDPIGRILFAESRTIEYNLLKMIYKCGSGDTSGIVSAQNDVDLCLLQGGFEIVRRAAVTHSLCDMLPEPLFDLSGCDGSGISFDLLFERDGSDRDQRSGDCGGGRKVVRPNFLSQLH